jgi:hypothetical protein
MQLLRDNPWHELAPLAMTRKISRINVARVLKRTKVAVLKTSGSPASTDTERLRIGRHI